MQFANCKRLWDKKKNEVITNTFVHSNFNYGCLIWHFSSKKSHNNVEKIHERSLKFLLNDYSTSVSMETKRLGTMVYETFKTLNNFNPIFMKDIFHYSPNATHKKHNLTSILKTYAAHVNEN